ncbi:MAG: aspartate aminotransferase family protein [Anaerolineaceae bacterium]|nr:aspartate aminotransferase family protein [Anaerolineaceae bacterium]MDE0329591.1 aspartate aminotransferase family protein [Anaerolineaceae bacterium]
MAQQNSAGAALMERYERVIFPAVAPYYPDQPLVVDRARDQELWDRDGKRYLDFFGGVLTISVGHCNEEITARTMEQLQRVQHTSTLFVNEIMVEVAEKLSALTPGALQKSFFTNSGSEADETAILAARCYTGNNDVIALRHAYSGRTLQAMSLTAHGNWRLGNVIDPHVRHVRSPYTYRAPLDLTPEEVVDLCIDDLEELIATCTNGRIAAFIAEPIQGVGGYIVPPQDYFGRVAPIIRAAGGVFISDEVQTGWGRTGERWWGIEHWGVEPDIMTFAKGMANGYPVGCTIATAEIADALPGMTFSTFGGNPVSMATALATIEYMERNQVQANAAIQGQILREKLEELEAEFDFIGEVRGMGLMQALEIVKPGPTREPDADRAAGIMARARDHGILIGKGGLHGNVVRIAPMLNVDCDSMQEGCELLARAVTSAAG